MIICALFPRGFSVAAAEIFIAAPGVGTGTTNSIPPFAFEETGASSVRYQQVYSASEFRNELPEGGTISGLSFITDQRLGRAFHTGWPSVQINLSVTPRGPDSLSPVFAENIGGNLLTVRQGGMALSATGPLSATSRIEFQTPYFYNPSTGNLLLDIRIFEPPDLPPDPRNRASPMWAADNPFGPDTVSRVFAYDVNAISGTADSVGLVTHFAVTPVPEPSTAALAVVSVCVFALWRRRKKVLTEKQ